MDTSTNHSYASCGVSIVGFVVAHITQSDIAWLVGIIAGIYTIISAHYNIKERRLRIKKMKDHV